MARIPRLLNQGSATVYHVMSRTALEGYPLGDVDKDILLELLKKLSGLYFVEILGFCLMGNHFHLLVRMLPEGDFSDEEIRHRVEVFFSGKRSVMEGELAKYREKLGSLSEFIKEWKQSFTRYYNKKQKRFGFFWGQRFKSVIVEDGETLVNCLAYIDLNPVRAGLVEKPEAYRWNSLGYLLQTGNVDDFLSLEFGLSGADKLSLQERIEKYRRFVYEIGSLVTKEGKAMKKSVVQTEEKKGFKITRSDRFKSRTRYFTDSGVIGSKKFVAFYCTRFEEVFQSRHTKKPIPIQGLEGCFSMKRLAFHGRGVP